MPHISHRRPSNATSLIVPLIAFVFALLVVYATGPGGPLAPPAGAPTFSQPLPELAPQPVDVTSEGLCLGLLNSSVLDFIGSSVGTPDSFDVGCQYKGDHRSKLGLLYYGGTQQFGTDLAIARADYGTATLIRHRFGVPALYYTSANLPQGWHSLLVEWITPGSAGDFQLKIGWHGVLKPQSPMKMIDAIDGVLFGQIRPTTQLAGSPLFGGGRPPAQ